MVNSVTIFPFGFDGEWWCWGLLNSDQSYFKAALKGEVTAHWCWWPLRGWMLSQIGDISCLGTGRKLAVLDSVG